ncbi:MAG: winged helix-turn-helix domain-containing protein [Nitrososphaerales archaeon]
MTRSSRSTFIPRRSEKYGLTRKRAVVDILGSILKALSEDPLKKTQLSYKANLDWRATDKYLKSLMKLELVAISDEDPSQFVITSKGRDFLKLYDDMMEFSRIEDIIQ